MKDYCTLEEARELLVEKGAPVALKFLRRLCADLPFTRPAGTVRVYRWSDVYSAFELSFKNKQRRAKAALAAVERKR